MNYKLSPQLIELFKTVLGVDMPNLIDFNILHQSVIPKLMDIHLKEAEGKPPTFDSKSKVEEQIRMTGEYNWIVWSMGDIYIGGTIENVMAEMAVLLLNLKQSNSVFSA